MGTRFTQVDAFTDRPFAGNPAAVVVLAGAVDEGWMQDVAAEMNLSETAFALRLHDGPANFGLRWFTPTMEVDLCGHATLATAHALWQEGHLGANEDARFATRSGLLTARRGEHGIELDFPAEPVSEVIGNATELDRIQDALGVPVLFAGRNRFDLLVDVGTEETVRAVRPDIRKVAQFPVRGLIVTGQAGADGYQFVSRFFAPNVGVDEDPVCGSAHCCLGPYWGGKLAMTELLGHQVSRRGGVVRVRMEGDRVRLIGRAVTVIRGEIL